jgi:hypothetical protein
MSFAGDMTGLDPGVDVSGALQEDNTNFAPIDRHPIEDGADLSNRLLYLSDDAYKQKVICMFSKSSSLP